MGGTSPTWPTADRAVAAGERRAGRTHRVLQVGCGPTGTSLLRQLLPRLAESGTPVSYEVADPAVMGPGLAFSTPYDLHLLNVRADRMSLHPDDRGEFARWRERHAERWTGDFDRPERGWDDYPPRRLFGTYTRWVLTEVLNSASARGQRVRLTGDRVVAVRRGQDREWLCRFGSGREMPYDTVVLAVGHLPSARCSPYDGGASFLRDPWNGLRPAAGARIGVIGTRLTAVDTALALRERGHEGPILLASRSGRLPSVKGRVTPYELAFVPRFVTERQRMGGAGTVSLEEVARVVGREVEAAEGTPVRWAEALHPPASSPALLRKEVEVVESGRVIAWQSALGAVVPWVPALWALLGIPGKELLMSTYVGAWAVRIASFPAVSARRLLAMMDEGQLSVRQGLLGVASAGRGHLMCFQDGAPVPVDVVVNATGPGYGVDSLDALPLTRELVRSRTAVPHRFGGIAVDERTFEARSADGTVAPGLHVVGDLTRGVWLATNAVENSVRQSVLLAEVVAGRLLSGSYRSRRGPGT